MPPYEISIFFRVGENNTVVLEFLQNLAGLSYASAGKLLSSYLAAKSEYDFSKLDVRKTIFQLTLSCNATLSECRYKDEEIDCCEHFYPVFTEHGYCFIFNGRYNDTWNKETPLTFRHTLFETDRKWNLRVVLSTPAYVFLHSFDEYSGLDFTPQVMWEDGFAADLLISMKQTYTTDQARQLSIAQRKCIFQDEVQLKFRNDSYTFTGCMRECRMKNSINLCGCVAPFYVSQMKDLRHCSAEQLECLARNAKNITDISRCLHCELGCFNTVFEIEKFTKT